MLYNLTLFNRNCYLIFIYCIIQNYVTINCRLIGKYIIIKIFEFITLDGVQEQVIT